MKKKILFWGSGLLLFVSLAVNVWFIFVQKDGRAEKTFFDRFTNGEFARNRICKDEDIKNFNELAKNYNYEKIDSMYSDISGREGYADDLDCLSILAISDVYLNRPSNAKPTIEKMKLLIERGGLLNKDINGINDINSLESIINSPEEIYRG